MRILVTFPGKFGDSIWALPTIRAISEAIREPVDLLVSPLLESIVPLFRRQAYLGLVTVWQPWAVQLSAPITPYAPPQMPPPRESFVPGEEYDRIIHLGYREWPTLPLPFYVYDTLRCDYPKVPAAPLDLIHPWIAAPYSIRSTNLVEGWADEWFELKYGLHWLLRNRFVYDLSGDPPLHLVNVSSGPRWQKEAGAPKTDWETAASWIAASRLFVGDCSALHVLAVAVGTPVVLVEPNEHRWNPIFYALGTTGPQVELVLGTDGRPTFDGRHLCDTVAARLKQSQPSPAGVS